MVLMLANDVRMVWVATLTGPKVVQVRSLGLRHHAENLATGRIFDLRNAYDTESEAKEASKALIVAQIEQFQATIDEMQGEVALLNATLEEL